MVILSFKYNLWEKLLKYFVFRYQSDKFGYKTKKNRFNRIPRIPEMSENKIYDDNDDFCWGGITFYIFNSKENFDLFEIRQDFIYFRTRMKFSWINVWALDIYIYI